MRKRLKIEETQWISIKFSGIKFHQKSFSDSQIFHPDRGISLDAKGRNILKSKKIVEGVPL